MKKIIIATLFPVVTSLGLWLGLGSSAAHATGTAPVDAAIVSANPAGPESESPEGNESEKAEGTESESQEAEAGGESEGAADTAAQHAACVAAGIDDTVTPNVQYDDQTGACSLDIGGSDEGGEQ